MTNVSGSFSCFIFVRQTKVEFSVTFKNFKQSLFSIPTCSIDHEKPIVGINYIKIQRIFLKYEMNNGEK